MARRADARAVVRVGMADARGASRARALRPVPGAGASSIASTSFRPGAARRTARNCRRALEACRRFYELMKATFPSKCEGARPLRFDEAAAARAGTLPTAGPPSSPVPRMAARKGDATLSAVAASIPSSREARVNLTEKSLKSPIGVAVGVGPHHRARHRRAHPAAGAALPGHRRAGHHDLHRLARGRADRGRVRADRAAGTGAARPRRACRRSSPSRTRAARSSTSSSRSAPTWAAR